MCQIHSWLQYIYGCQVDVKYPNNLLNVFWAGIFFCDFKSSTPLCLLLIMSNNIFAWGQVFQEIVNKVISKSHWLLYLRKLNQLLYCLLLVNVGEDCPVFDGLFEFCQLSTGGSIGECNSSFLFIVLCIWTPSLNR